MKKNFREKIYIILGIFLLIYIIFCDIFLTFSISVTMYFLVMSMLFFMLTYIEKNPIKKSERGPSFRYVFVKVASLMLFSATLIMLLFNIFYPKHFLTKKEKYDYIIVFGAGIKDGKTDIINSRIDKAIEYAKNYDACRFVLTGAKGVDEPIEEAYYMKNYMTKRGISDKNIIVDPFSTNTEENIVNSLTLIKNDAMKRNTRENIIKRPFMNKEGFFDIDFLNIGFMSSEFHLTRINLMAKSKGINRPYNIVCHTNPLYILYMYIRENLSMFKAVILNQLKM